MAFKFFLAFVLFSSFLVNFCNCFPFRRFHFNHSLDDSEFSPAVATWYKDPTIAGSGGACGLENDVAEEPYNAMITAGNQVLFKYGKGCGACYQVKCTASPLCSGEPITVTLTDECPGSCNDDPVHFDLSWIAFGYMAKSGQADPLRMLGRIDIQYKRVQCSYPQLPVVFKVDQGSSQYWLGVAVENVNGDGDVGSIEFQVDGSDQWLQTTRTFGTTHASNLPSWANGKAISIRLTQASGKTLVAKNVIPPYFQARQHYWADANF